MSERKLARLVKIDRIVEIEGAERIELAMIGGWQVVVQKGLYQPGSLAVYCEVDSLVPTDLQCFADLPNRLSSKLLFEVNGKPYARIKTAKMMKQLSQGYCIPLAEVPGVIPGEVDADMTKQLGVIKYEKPEEKSMNNTGGNVTQKIRTFPSFIPKTDQNRVQNIVPRYLQSVQQGEQFEKSFKLDGSSLTAWIKNGELGVASRNVAFNPVSEKRSFIQTLKHFFIDQMWEGGKSFAKSKWEPVIPANDNAFTKMAHEAGLISMLREFHADTGRSIAIQGEMVGPSIQKNFEGRKQNEFFVFDIFDIDKQEYLLPGERRAIVDEYGLRHVPLATATFGTVLLPTVAEAIADADGPSGLGGKYREGFVYKSMTRDFSFKVISNRYLLKEE